MNWPKDDPHCGTCGEQIPCSCDPCDIGQCYHKAHCDVCGKGVDVELEDGICMECSIEWQAKHQINFPVPVLAEPPELPSRVAPKPEHKRQARESTSYKASAVSRNSRGGENSLDGGEGQCEWLDERDRIQNERDM